MKLGGLSARGLSEAITLSDSQSSSFISVLGQTGLALPAIRRSRGLKIDSTSSITVLRATRLCNRPSLARLTRRARTASQPHLRWSSRTSNLVARSHCREHLTVMCFFPQWIGWPGRRRNTQTIFLDSCQSRTDSRSQGSAWECNQHVVVYE